MSQFGEDKLKEKFIKLISSDFIFRSEVKGSNLITKEKIIVDFLIFPRPHLISEGFEPMWFGVEVKHFGEPRDTGKMSRLIWQCITYVQSEYEIDGQIIQPAFVLEYSDILEMNKKYEDREYLSQWIGMIRVAGLAHVGSFSAINPKNQDQSSGWCITFSSSKYFYLIDGKYHHLKNYNIHKQNIGNCAN